MTDADWIEDLERKARAATPGPWSADGYGSGHQVTGATGTIFADAFALPENAKFIAAADPDTILRLIKQAQNYNAEADRHASRVVALEAENEDLTAERDQWREMYQAQVHLAHVSDMKVAAVEALAKGWADMAAQAADDDTREWLTAASRSVLAALSAAPTDTDKETP